MLSCLRQKDWRVTGYDVDPARSECRSLAELCQSADVVLLSLPDGPTVSNVIEEGIAPCEREGLVVVDCSTDEPDTARRMEAFLTERGMRFLDAPVSGGPAGAASGALTILVGGAHGTLEEARPVLDALAREIIHVGDAGCGQVAKLVNNLLVASQLLIVSEGVRLGHKAGVEPKALLDGINACSGRSAVSEINFPRWVLSESFDSGFSTGLMRKDVRLALELASRVNVPLEIGRLVGKLWTDRSTIADDDDFNRIADPKGER